MDIQTALSNLYSASRLAPLTADQHDKLRESAEVLHKHVTSAENAEPATTKSEVKDAQES